jgi:hypothetical protein
VIDEHPVISAAEPGFPYPYSNGSRGFPQFIQKVK